MDFKGWEDEQTRLNNEIIVPAYRQFCRENNLAFHFRDELPNELFNPEVEMEEHKLHQEAMNCFNNLKQKYVLFNNKIYTYHFTDWGASFEFQSWQIDDFLNQANELENTDASLQRQLDTALGHLRANTLLFLIVLIGLMFHLLKVPYELYLIVLIAAIAITFFFQNKLFKKPLKE